MAQESREEWKSRSQRISERLTIQVEAIKERLLQEQVKLIKSIPLDAIERVNKLSIEAFVSSSRSSEAIKEIMRSGEVSEGKARVIARTETSRAAATFTEQRAKNVGSEGYIWRTSRAAGTRHSHAEMEGKFVRWDDPPTLDGLTGHAGCLPNCRCYAEVVFPEEDD